MKLRSIKTARIQAGSTDICKMLGQFLPKLHENEIVAVTSKVVSLCENRVVPMNGTDKEELLVSESERYLPRKSKEYEFRLTITDNTLIPMAGIDSSNGDDYYVLWPENPQRSANRIRHYLTERDNLKNIGVVITDSTSQPLRRGTTGIVLAHSGFLGLRDYVGSPDLFGRPFGVSKAGVASGLAAAAVLAMGEGAEQTPLCIISDVPFVDFQPRDPTGAELRDLYISPEEDLFGPFIDAADWQPGRRERLGD
jgi:F420-0:gamma-glutamyl ligase